MNFAEIINIGAIYKNLRKLLLRQCMLYIADILDIIIYMIYRLKQQRYLGKPAGGSSGFLPPIKRITNSSRSKSEVMRTPP